MAIPDLLFADLIETMSGLKTARGKPMSFALIPAKKQPEKSPGYVIVGRPGSVNERLRLYKRMAPDLLQFAYDKPVRGEVSFHNGRLVFVAEDDFDESLAERLRTVWPRELKKAPEQVTDAKGRTVTPQSDAKKVSVLLKRAQLLTQAQADATHWDEQQAIDVDADYGDALSMSELEEIFGDDASTLVRTARAKAEQLDRLDVSASAAPDMDSLDVLARDVESALADGVEPAIARLRSDPSVLRWLAGLTQAAVQPTPGSLGDAALQALNAVKSLDVLLSIWDRRIDELEQAKEAIMSNLEAQSALQAEASPGEPDDDAERSESHDALEDDLQRLLNKHTHAGAASLAAEKAVNEALNTVQSMLKAATAQVG